MRGPSGTRALAVVLVVGQWLAGCAVNVDLSNKQCPCTSGWTCDTARNLCVKDLPSTTCSKDTDCSDPSTPRCSPAGTCVQCLPDSDNCPVGQYCLPTNECAPGCKVNSDCETLSPSVPLCDAARHKCVECLSKTQCQGSKQCSPSGLCVDSCQGGGSQCTAPAMCCTSLCVDTRTDAFNCGSCGNVCMGTGAACCGSACTSTFTDVSNCGQCGTACVTVHGAPSCATGSCKWSCETGWAHCATGNTGCETDVSSNVQQCGSCTNNCLNAVKNADGIGCSSSKCTYTACKPGFFDCNGRAADGCECACNGPSGACCGLGGQPCCGGAGGTCQSGYTCESDGQCH